MRWNLSSNRVNGNDRRSPRKNFTEEDREERLVNFDGQKSEGFFLRGFGIAIRATGDWSHSRLTLIGPTHCQVWLELGVTTVSNPVIRSVHRGLLSPLFLLPTLWMCRDKSFGSRRPLTDIFAIDSLELMENLSKRRTMISWKIKLVEIDRNSGTIIYTENIEIVIWFFFSRVAFYDHDRF